MSVTLRRRVMMGVMCVTVFFAAFTVTIAVLEGSGRSAVTESLNEIKNEAEEQGNKVEITAELTSQERVVRYIVKEYKGDICVFNAGYEDRPAVITDIDPDSLPTNDRELLFQGIEIYSNEELLMLLEDLGS